MNALEKPEWHQYLEAHLAANEAEVQRLKEAGKDPIVTQFDEHEARLYTKSPEIIKRIRMGHAWHAGEDAPDELGYVFYSYTRLSAKEIEGHLNDPRRSGQQEI